MPIPASACTCPCLYLPQPVPAPAYTCLRLYLSKVVPTLGCTHRWSVMGGNRPCSDGGLVVRGKTCSFMPPSASFSSKSWDTCRWFWKHTCKVSRGCIASYLHHRKCQWLDRNSRIRALAHHLQQTSRHLSTQLSNRFPNTYQWLWNIYPNDFQMPINSSETTVIQNIPRHLSTALKQHLSNYFQMPITSSETTFIQHISRHLLIALIQHLSNRKAERRQSSFFRSSDIQRSQKHIIINADPIMSSRKVILPVVNIHSLKTFL